MRFSPHWRGRHGGSVPRAGLPPWPRSRHQGLTEHLANDAQALARFEREAKAVAALSHANILVLFDVGAHEGIHYAVTELLEGETLRDRLSRSPLSWRKTVELGMALAEGLAAAHGKDIIHRDIKPGNIFLTAGGQIKILDFGPGPVAAKRSLLKTKR